MSLRENVRVLSFKYRKQIHSYTMFVYGISSDSEHNPRQNIIAHYLPEPKRRCKAAMMGKTPLRKAHRRGDGGQRSAGQKKEVFVGGVSFPNPTSKTHNRLSDVLWGGYLNEDVI